MNGMFVLCIVCWMSMFQPRNQPWPISIKTCKMMKSMHTEQKKQVDYRSHTCTSDVFETLCRDDGNEVLGVVDVLVNK